MRKLFLSILLTAVAFSCMAQETGAADIGTSTVNTGKSIHSDGVDDVLQYTPLAATIALKLFGLESKSEWGNLLINTTTTYANTAIISYMLKHSVNSTRPDGTDNHSFPSAHTAIAFCRSNDIGQGIRTHITVDYRGRLHHCRRDCRRPRAPQPSSVD